MGPVQTDISSLNSAMPQSPNSQSGAVLPAFGGESVGFAADVSAAYAKGFYAQAGKPARATVPTNMVDQDIPAAIGNKYALFNFQGFNGAGSQAATKFYTDQPDNILMGGEGAKGISLPSLINWFKDKYPKIQYSPSEFLYSKYYKKIPLNHLITLRRFPMPVTDNIYNYQTMTASENGTPDSNTETDATMAAGVTAITYMGATAGNQLEELLKMSFGLKWKQLDAKFEEIELAKGMSGFSAGNMGMGGIAGNIVNATVDAGQGTSYKERHAAKYGKGALTGDKLGTTYADFVLGPVNVVDNTTIRDRGINFQNDMRLQFEYELRSLAFINPKVAMIDIMSNMLTMTTNNASFFGGGHRYYGSAGDVGTALGDTSALQNGDFVGYFKSIASDIKTGFTGLFGGADGEFDGNKIKEALKTIGTNLLGNMMGGFLGNMGIGNTATAATRSFISGEPTGDWHVTVGNPLNPICMMGNMICDSTEMELGQGLGYDDFPMEVKFNINLKHGKPRDKGDIENMFNAGQGRIYAAIQDEADYLNLDTTDTPVQTYGNIPTGTNDIQQSSQLEGGTATNGYNAGAPASTFPPDQIKNIDTAPDNLGIPINLFEGTKKAVVDA